MRAQISDDFGLTETAIVFELGGDDEYVLADWFGDDQDDSLHRALRTQPTRPGFGTCDLLLRGRTRVRSNGDTRHPPAKTPGGRLPPEAQGMGARANFEFCPPAVARGLHFTTQCPSGARHEANHKQTLKFASMAPRAGAIRFALAATPRPA